MGDLLPPRRDVFDRLRRRIESYRQHQVSRVNQRFDSLANGLYKQQRRDTALLHQRWLDSKAKRSQKSSSSKASRAAGNVDPATANVPPAAVEPGSAPPQPPVPGSHLSVSCRSLLRTFPRCDTGQNKRPARGMLAVECRTNFCLCIRINDVCVAWERLPSDRGSSRLFGKSGQLGTLPFWFV